MTIEKNYGHEIFGLWQVKRTIKYNKNWELDSYLEMTSEEENYDVMSYFVMIMQQKIILFERD